jgi:hypothetical protein
MSSVPNQDKRLQEYEKRIIELRMALRWVREACALVPPDARAETLAQIQQHAVVALMYDDDIAGN